VSSWKEEFEGRMAWCVVKLGQAVREDASAYSWVSWDDYIREHVLECGLLERECAWKDYTWTEFQGTFAESPMLDVKGVEAIVSCKCGLVTRQPFRYSGGYARLLRELTDGGGVR
jgi:hypothetical protein